ncbi:MAG: hypothetical protein QM820_57655 [Minicystis sp.]
MIRYLAAMGFAAGLALGCGSVVVEPGQSAGSATGSGGSAGLGGAGGSGFGGAGGAITSTVASSSTIVSSGVGGGPACLADPTLFVEVDGDIMDHLGASCVPTGSVLYNTGPVPPPPGPPPLPPGYLTLFGCTTAASDLGLIISALSSQWPGPATVAGVSIELHKGGGKYTTSPNMSDGLLVVTTFEATGGVLEGTFSGTLKTSWSSSGGSVIAIKGSFRVCHTADSFTV